MAKHVVKVWDEPIEITVVQKSKSVLGLRSARTWEEQ
jgi:hypothetical protein